MKLYNKNGAIEGDFAYLHGNYLYVFRYLPTKRLKRELADLFKYGTDLSSIITALDNKYGLVCYKVKTINGEENIKYYDIITKWKLASYIAEETKSTKIASAKDFKGMIMNNNIDVIDTIDVIDNKYEDLD